MNRSKYSFVEKSIEGRYVKIEIKVLSDIDALYRCVVKL